MDGFFIIRRGTQKTLNRENEKNRKKQHPFDYITDEEFERIFSEMQRFIDSESFRELVEDILRDSVESEDHIIHGIIGKSIPCKRGIDEMDGDFDEESIPSPFDREQIADIIKDDIMVYVTMPLPNVRKKDIRLRLSSQELEIIINREGKTLYDSIELAALVDPETAIASFNNGILDVTVERRQLYDKSRSIDIK